MFRQVQEPGRQGLSDFTKLKGVMVTIAGEPLEHRLYHFRLAYSSWSHLTVVLGGESFSALAEGLQEALWRLGGAPLEHRTDSLSAAFKNLSVEVQRDLTECYEALCAHYGMAATRNNRGVSHENGAVESPHGHIKRRIAQALLLRGSADFATVEEYRQWLDALVGRFNRRCSEALAVERGELQALPARRTTDYSEQVVSVTTSSTIEVKRVLYSVRHASGLPGSARPISMHTPGLRLRQVGSALALACLPMWPSPSSNAEVPRPLEWPSAPWERLAVAAMPVAAVAIANRSHNRGWSRLFRSEALVV